MLTLLLPINYTLEFLNVTHVFYSIMYSYYYYLWPLSFPEIKFSVDCYSCRFITLRLSRLKSGAHFYNLISYTINWFMMLTVALGVSTVQTRRDSSLNLGNAACFLPSATDSTAVNGFCWVSYAFTRNCNICEGLSVFTIYILLKLWRKSGIKWNY